MKYEVIGLKIERDIGPGADLSKIIIEEAEKQGDGIEENDVIAITSKIVSKAEGRMYKITDVKPSRKARFLSRFYKISPEVMELYLQQGKVEAVIPIEKLARKYGYLFEEYVRNKEGAQKAIRKEPYIFLIDVGNRLLTWGGVDFSNAPPGYCTALPINPDKSAKRIREGIRSSTSKDTAVVITDTEWKLDIFGTVDIALGCSGIQPLSRNFGEKDLYGKPKFGGVDNLADLFAASANLLFGQTTSATPIVIIRDLKYERSEKGVGDIVYPHKIFRKGLRILAWETIKFKLISKFA